MSKVPSFLFEIERSSYLELRSKYLELLSISNKKLGTLDIYGLCKLFLFLYLELLYLEFFSFRTKILVPFDYFSLYLELFLFTQQTERKCSIFENSNVIKTFEIQKFDYNQSIIKVFLN